MNSKKSESDNDDAIVDPQENNNVIVQPAPQTNTIQEHIDNATTLSNNLVLTWENRIPLLEQNYHTVLNRLRTRVNALQNDTFNLQNDPLVDNFNPSSTDEFITHIENQNTLNQQEASILSMLIRLRRFYPIINNQGGGSLPQAREVASILLTLRAELQIIQNQLRTTPNDPVLLAEKGEIERQINTVRRGNPQSEN